MPICICPNCEKQHKVPVHLVGSRARCSQCRESFVLQLKVADRQQPALPPPEPPAIDFGSESRRHEGKSVAPLVKSPALSFIAFAYTFVGFATVLGVLIVIAFFFAAEVAGGKRGDFPVLWLLMTPWGGAVILGALGLIAAGELIRIAVRIEARLHEMSKNSR